MKVAGSQNRDLVIDILSASFDDNQSINFIVKQGINRMQRVRYLMNYCFTICQKHGNAYLSEDEQACALILFSEKRKRAFVRDLLLTLRCIGIGNMFKVMKREKMLSSYHPNEPFYYLWFIGVLPEKQSKGIGTKLLKEVLRKCDEDHRAIYLETSVIKNISWYQRFGFEVFNELDLGYNLCQMIRY